jgi:LemA protein
MLYMLIFIIVLIAAALWAVSLFNGLVGKSNQVKNAFSDIDVQLKKRYDLVPNIVEAVKGYAGHESSVLEGVTKARAEALNVQTGTPDTRAQAEGAFTGALKSLFAITENYPELKASESYKKLQDQLTALEGDIESARRYYNAAVREMNTAVQVFPANLIAGTLGFTQSVFFGASEEEKATPKVSL